MSDDQTPINRRRFFREGFRELLKPLAKAIEPVERAAHQLGALDDVGAVISSPKLPLSVYPNQFWLRPPGALPEQSFRDVCSRCGECVKVCPAQCIKIDHSGVKGNGAPYIEADAMPCVVCTGLECMHHCPSGALVPTVLAEIDMGTAEWREEHCVRTRSEDCTICIDQCPLGSAAIELREGRVHVIEEGCIGCGVCQHYCPTSPKSIVVIPVSQRTTP